MKTHVIPDKIRSSESTDGGAKSEQEQVPLASRRRPSFTILYTDSNRDRDVHAPPENEPWCFTVQVETSDDSEVLSIQVCHSVLETYVMNNV